jgi:hypothetical protein
VLNLAVHTLITSTKCLIREHNHYKILLSDLHKAALFILQLLIFVATSIRVLMVCEDFYYGLVHTPGRQTLSSFLRNAQYPSSDGRWDGRWIFLRKTAHSHIGLFGVVTKRTAKPQREEFYSWCNRWGTANLYEMVVANLTDCSAVVCFTWFYNFPVRTVSLRHWQCIHIWNRLPYDPWSCGHPWFQRVTLTSSFRCINPCIHQSMTRNKTGIGLKCSV